MIGRFLIGLIPAWLCAAALASAAPVAKSENKADKTVNVAETMRKTLDLTVTVEYASQPLPTVLSALGEEHKINIVLDKSVIQNLGVDPSEMNIDFKARNVKLRTALRNMLNQFNLSFGIVGDTLLVSTEDNIIYRQLKHRVAVDIDNTPLNKALRDLAKDNGVNIVIDPRTMKTKLAESPVTLQVDDVPLETAVRLMAEMAGLRPVRMGNVLFVTSEERAEKLKDSDSLVPNPGLPGAGPGIVIPGLPGGLAPGGVVPVAPALPAVPAGGAPKERDTEEKKEPEKP